MKTALGLLLGFLATAMWGSFYIVGRWLFGEEGDKLNPYLFNLLRFWLAVCAFSPLLFFAHNREMVKRALTRDLKTFLLIALIGIVLENSLVFYSLKFTTSARCSLLANCSPIATVILAYWLLKEQASRREVLGMLIGFAGIILAGLARGGDIYASTGLHTLIGDAMALASGFCWAFFTVYGARVSSYSGGVSMLICFALGTLIMIPVNLAMTSAADFAQLTPRIWAGLLYTGAVTLSLANACWYAALRYLKPGMLGAFGYLSAAITFVLSSILLNEQFTTGLIAAIVLVLGGMALMLAPRRKNLQD